MSVVLGEAGGAWWVVWEGPKRVWYLGGVWRTAVGQEDCRWSWKGLEGCGSWLERALKGLVEKEVGRMHHQRSLDGL